ncbi:hypothetical protein Tco_1452876, partial [Tanacetum coccineum]
MVSAAEFCDVVRPTPNRVCRLVLAMMVTRWRWWLKDGEGHSGGEAKVGSVVAVVVTMMVHGGGCCRSDDGGGGSAGVAKILAGGGDWRPKKEKRGWRLEVPHSETYLNNMENQSVHAMQDFEQPPAVDFIDNEIHSDSNIIQYSQYLQETQQEKRRYIVIAISFSTLNIYLNSREKMIDSQMDDMIKEKLALKEQVDPLEQNLSKQIKENECLLQTFNVFKSESKKKEDKYMENKIDLEKKIKELDNII